MKKTLSLLLSLVMVVSVFGIVPMTAEAYSDKATDAWFSKESDYRLEDDEYYYDSDDDCYYFSKWDPCDIGDYICIEYYDDYDDEYYYDYYDYCHNNDYSDEWFENEDGDCLYPSFWIEEDDIYYNGAYVSVSIIGYYDYTFYFWLPFYCEHDGTGRYTYVSSPATTSSNGTYYICCDFCDDALSSGTIPRISYVSLTKTEYTFNGNVKTPGVVVKDANGSPLINGTDYTVSYAGGRVNVGEYAVKITFKGKYYGTVTRSFDIYPQSTKFTKKKAKKKAVTLKWKRAYQVSGYQIQYSTKKNFKNAKNVNAKAGATSKTIKKLKSGKKYYFRIRAYKYASSYTYYTGWSTGSAKVK